MATQVLPLGRGNKPHPTKVENLMALVYSSNTCYTNVVRVDLNNLPRGTVSIDPKKGTWVREGVSNHNSIPQELAIGGALHCEYGCRWGVIGIYDQSDLDHISRMKDAAQKAVEDDTFSMD